MDQRLAPFQLFPGPDFARSPNRHLFRNFVLTLTRVKVSAGWKYEILRTPSWQHQGLFEQLLEKLLQQRKRYVHAGLLDAFGCLVPDGIVAGGVEELMAGPGQPQCDCPGGLAVAVRDDFSVNQAGFDEQGRMIHALLFGVSGKVGLGVFALGFQQQQPDEIHVPFHALAFPTILISSGVRP